MERPLFSIVVPIYNVQEYLKKCIESILCQTYPHFELILVDDGSTDGCNEICETEKKNDERIIVIHKPNGGLVSARKAGAIAARGDHIICVDGDDWIDRNLLSDACNIILQHDPDLISFGYYEAYGEYNRSISCGKTKRYDKDEIVQEVYPALIYPSQGKRFPNNIWGKVYKKDLYLEHQLAVDDSISMGEDTACVVPYVASCKSLYVSEKCMYFYRQNASAMTKVKKPLSWASPKLIDALLREKLSRFDYDFDSQISDRTLHAVFNVGASQFYRNESYLKVCAAIKEHYSEDYIRKACKGTISLNVERLLIRITVKMTAVFLLFICSKIRKK